MVARCIDALCERCADTAAAALVEAGTVIREEQEGFKFHLNLQKRDKAEAIHILEGILARLKA